MRTSLIDAISCPPPQAVRCVSWKATMAPYEGHERRRDVETTVLKNSSSSQAKAGWPVLHAQPPGRAATDDAPVNTRPNPAARWRNHIAGPSSQPRPSHWTDSPDDVLSQPGKSRKPDNHFSCRNSHVSSVTSDHAITHPWKGAQRRWHVTRDNTVALHTWQVIHSRDPKRLRVRNLSSDLKCAEVTVAGVLRVCNVARGSQHLARTCSLPVCVR